MALSEVKKLLFEFNSDLNLNQIFSEIDSELKKRNIELNSIKVKIDKKTHRGFLKLALKQKV